MELLGGIGTGVMDFFYEPAKGLTESPAAFGKGLAKGSMALVKGTIGSVFGAASKITNAAGKGGFGHMSAPTQLAPKLQFSGSWFSAAR